MQRLWNKIMNHDSFIGGTYICFVYSMDEIIYVLNIENGII